MKMTYLLTRLVLKVFISSSISFVLLSCSNTCLPNICSVNMCFFLFFLKSEFPIKQKGETLVFIKVSHTLNQCGRWDLNEFPNTANPQRKELSAHQLIKCNQKCNQLVNRSFFLKEKICIANGLQVREKDNSDRGC